MTKSAPKQTELDLAPQAEEDPAEAGRRERRIARAAKEVAVQFERTNERYLYLYYSTGGWWKMGGRSALIYAYRLAPRIPGLKPPKILNDSDYYANFKYGIVAIKDIERFRKNISSIGVNLKEETDTYQLYDTGFKVTSTELKKLMGLELARKERVNQIVMPKNIFPDINMHIVDIHKMVRTMVYKMAAPDQRFYGRPILEQVQQASVEYKTLANGEIEPIEGLQKLSGCAKQMLYRLHDMVELGIEIPEKRMELARQMSELKRLILAELKKLERKNAKARTTES